MNISYNYTIHFDYLFLFARYISYGDAMQPRLLGFASYPWKVRELPENGLRKDLIHLYPVSGTGSLYDLDLSGNLGLLSRYLRKSGFV